VTLSNLAVYAVTIVVVAAVTVLCALGKVDGNVAVGAIVGLGGVHLVGTIATPTTTNITNPPPKVVPVPPPPPAPPVA
jgi:hypothetical protein